MMKKPTFGLIVAFAGLLLSCVQSPADAFSTTSLPWCRNALVTVAESKASSEAESSATGRRQPWDVLRFVRQSSRFVSPPKVPFFPSGRPKVVRPGDIIWSPSSSSSSNPFQWAPLDDVVMGGVSSSTVDNGTGVWRGTVSSANSGGFVGVRSTPMNVPLDMSKCKGIELVLRGGDGKRFKAVVRDSDEFNGVCWTSSFDAPKKGGAVRLPFQQQVPTIFARTVPGKTFRAGNVMGFQLAYSKFEYDGALNPNFALGEFSLEISEVRAY